jgi:UDP-N-acetylmuramoyl-L-alanyl-D-glutamate--2,6-diaminopimelate ligase
MKLSKIQSFMPGAHREGTKDDRSIMLLVYDSRKAVGGTLFFCIVGAVEDGHKYAADAYKTGCRAFVVERVLPLPDDAAQIVVPDSRAALADAAAGFYDYPSKKLKIIGITGTKGKTTTTIMTAAILNAAGMKTGYISTCGVSYGNYNSITANSTPESLDLQRHFSQLVSAGAEYVVMEVSSQAVKQRRIRGLRFAAGAFLNLSPDHIGGIEHKDFDEYRDCKTEFIRSYVDGPVVYNASCKHSDYVTADVENKISFSSSAEIEADYISTNAENYMDSSELGVTFDVCIKNGSRVGVKVPQPGMFSVENALASIAIAGVFGVKIEDAVKTLASIKVCGRFEIVGDMPERTFVIDYAHNEASLRAALGTLRAYNPKRLVCLFGSVGGRSQSRRAGLGAAASELADFCIITADNPAEEPVSAISDEIIAGFTRDCERIRINDREEAVRYAVDHSRPGDIVLFAGKGHENYQLINGRHIPFSEKKIIEDECAAIKREYAAVNGRLDEMMRVFGG